jgi:hypothetical protein
MHPNIDTLAHTCKTRERLGTIASLPATSCAPVAQLDRALAYEAWQAT